MPSDMQISGCMQWHMAFPTCTIGMSQYSALSEAPSVWSCMGLSISGAHNFTDTYQLSQRGV